MLPVLDALTIAIIGGLVGGIIRSILGWASQEPPEPFNGMKMLKSMIRAAIGGIIIVYGLIVAGTSLTFIGAIIIAITGGTGTDVIWHDITASG